MVETTEPRRIRIWIDRSPFVIYTNRDPVTGKFSDHRSWTGAELRRLQVPMVDGSRDLFMRGRGIDMDSLIRDEDTVDLRDEDVFMTNPRHITGG